jgi:hypothetical protein
MTGHFRRTTWYQDGFEHGNPKHNDRFRVNAPAASLHPDFMHRNEVRGNGMMQILIREDLSRLTGAELYVELWGGHPGTANKRVTVNGRSTYTLPETGTAAGHCTHGYPTLPLKLTDMVNGYNALQFACDQGTTFWGHFIVDNAALRVTLEDDHPDLKSLNLTHFEAAVRIEPMKDETYHLYLETTMPDAIDRVIFTGIYQGYDENGNGATLDRHGFTKAREPVAVLGIVDHTPFTVTWNTSMLPVCDHVAVEATVILKAAPALTYRTPPTPCPAIIHPNAHVALYPAMDLPAPFWSRAGQVKWCRLPLDVDPARIQRGELHVVIWDGGRGTIDEPFTLNGHPVDVAGAAHHDVLYHRVPIDPAWLRRGDNEIVVHSDTEHHGIEVLLPGPALTIRS